MSQGAISVGTSPDGQIAIMNVRCEPFFVLDAAGAEGLAWVLLSSYFQLQGANPPAAAVWREIVGEQRPSEYRAVLQGYQIAVITPTGYVPFALSPAAAQAIGLQLLDAARTVRGQERGSVELWRRLMNSGIQSAPS